METKPPSEAPSDPPIRVNRGSNGSPPKNGYELVLNKPWSILYGALYGILARLIFHGDKSNVITQGLSAMTVSFALLAPFAIGAITVYMAERQMRQSYRFYLFGPWIAVSLFLTGTAMALLEGSICIIMAGPLFLIQGSIGGLVMGICCRMMNRPVRTMQTIAVLPLLLALVEGQIKLPDDIRQVKQSIRIDAPPSVVWQHINFPLDIQPAEMKGGIAYLIGVPYPIEARTLDGRVGGIRHLKWQRGVAFDEKITEWEPQRKVAWTYHFGPDSFPPGSMDEHVVVGGKYFDLVDTSYTLTPLGQGTQLDVLVNYRVSTNFNWYSGLLAQGLIDNTASTILHFYKVRSEKTVKPLAAN
jgi:hypothetical protein